MMQYQMIKRCLILCIPMAGFLDQSCMAAIFQVDLTVQDHEDANAGDGVCAIASGDYCTLRAAVMEANALPGIDLIVLPGDNAIIRLTRQGTGNSANAGDLDITESVTIGTFIEPLDALPTIDATDLDNRVFDVRPGVELFTLQNVKLRGGSNANGGGIYIRDGAIRVDISRVSFRDLQAENYGGAVYNLNAELNINDSSFSSNNAGINGAAIFNDCGDVIIHSSSLHANPPAHVLFSNVGALWHAKRLSNDNACLLVMRASTISESASGAAISISDPTFAGILTATIVDVSLVQNRSALGVEANTKINLANTLFTGSILDNCSFLGNIQTSENNKSNVDDGNSCFQILGSNSYLNTDPELQLLTADDLDWHHYASPQNHSLLIDSGDYLNCSSTDQLGLPKPIDGDGDGSAICDIGAIEYVQPSLLFTDSFEN